MARKLISAEKISKQYQLGVLGGRTLQEDIREWWKKNKKQPAEPKSNSRLWALRDISFDVFEGEVLGLIGKNGAGKSTLLKILSRITLPTSGTISGIGRIASLLEVGTGFHGELTGRENIYLNGNIMGMKRKEIDRKFDEIIEFSGVEQFLDTPVKRYSSGMYVRLAFSVAAHLDPEILVIDEVLAVGDAAFQQKCMAKIKAISQQEGKTILFVSHNVHTIRNLCNRALVLEKGELILSGNPGDLIAGYEQSVQEESFSAGTEESGADTNPYIQIIYVRLNSADSSNTRVLDVETDLNIEFEFSHQLNDGQQLSSSINVFRNNGDLLFRLRSEDLTLRKGNVRGRMVIPGNFLSEGGYYLSLSIAEVSGMTISNHQSCLSFSLKDKTRPHAEGKWPGIVRPFFPY